MAHISCKSYFASAFDSEENQPTQRGGIRFDSPTDTVAWDCPASSGDGGSSDMGLATFAKLMDLAIKTVDHELDDDTPDEIAVKTIDDAGDPVILLFTIGATAEEVA
jgi:hypothetical protein